MCAANTRQAGRVPIDTEIQKYGMNVSRTYSLDSFAITNALFDGVRIFDLQRQQRATAIVYWMGFFVMPMKYRICALYELDWSGLNLATTHFCSVFVLI